MPIAPPVAPGSWPLVAADVRCLLSRYTRTGKLARIFRNSVTCQRGELAFLTTPARVLLLVAHDPGIRLRDIAASLDITERSAFGIIADLVEAGYVVKEKDGRGTRYHIQAHLVMLTEGRPWIPAPG